jgi:hypothetical protein
LVSVKGDNSESWITFWIVKAVFIFPHVSLTAQELSGKLFGEIPRVTYPLNYYYHVILCAGTKRIECIRSDGLGRRIVSTEASHPFGLSLLNNILYWTDWNK